MGSRRAAVSSAVHSRTVKGGGRKADEEKAKGVSRVVVVKLLASEESAEGELLASEEPAKGDLQASGGHVEGGSS